MQDIIEKLNSMITIQKSSNMTPEQESYIAGLADALQVVEDSLSNEIVIGRIYFVIMYEDNDRCKPYIEKMRLYRINKKQKMSYCFTKYLSGNITNPDLVLSSKGGLISRVYTTKEKAQNSIFY